MTLNKQRLLIFLKKILGTYYYKFENPDVSFYCPFCNHYKRKLTINIDIDSEKFGKWHCWVCYSKGKSIYSLLKKINVSENIIKELNEIIPKNNNSSNNFNNNNVGNILDSLNNNDKNYKQIITLPKDFIPLRDAKAVKTPVYKKSINYLKNRNVTDTDILKYNIGYCESGIYNNRIIIPSYDKDGNLNYFVGRSIYKDNKLKYKNPSISKNIIMFELFIDFTKELTLVEGVFDAIAVRRNVIPLLGKTLSNNLKKRIISNNPSRINIALDSDALKSSIKLSKFFIDNGIDNTYLIKLPENKDPSNLGFNKIWNLIDNSKKINSFDILKMEI